MQLATKIYIALFVTFIPIWILLYQWNNYINDANRFYQREEEYHLVQAEISAYTSSVDETDETPNVMADGTNTRRGAIACPSKYSFGTKVVIGNDTYFCADRMNRRYRDSEHFDIWVHDKKEAFDWGRRTLTIKIIH